MRFGNKDRRRSVDMENRETQEKRADTASAPAKSKARGQYQKPEVKKQGNLKEITALSFDPPG
jgi:hypothetical protein